MMPEYIVPKHIVKANGKAEGEPHMPIGVQLEFAGEKVPEGWMEADGRVLMVKDYPELAEVVSGYYMENLYTIEVKRWWIFYWTTHKRFDTVKEYGIFRLPKIWHARFTAHSAEDTKD